MHLAGPLVPPLDSTLATPTPPPVYTADKGRMRDRVITAYGVCMARHGGAVAAYDRVERDINIKLGAAR